MTNQRYCRNSISSNGCLRRTELPFFAKNVHSLTSAQNSQNEQNRSKRNINSFFLIPTRFYFRARKRKERREKRKRRRRGTLDRARASFIALSFFPFCSVLCRSFSLYSLRHPFPIPIPIPIPILFLDFNREDRERERNREREDTNVVVVVVVVVVVFLFVIL